MTKKKTTNNNNATAYTGNIHKLGRLLSHEWWSVTDKENKTKERYIFLFKSRILICKVRRISDERSVFILKDIIKVLNTVFCCCCCYLFKFVLDQSFFLIIYLNIDLVDLVECVVS